MKNYFSYFKGTALSYLAVALVLTSVPLYAEESCCAQTENCYTNIVENGDMDHIKIPERPWYKKIKLSKVARKFRGPAIVAASPLIGCIAASRIAGTCIFFGAYPLLPIAFFAFPFYTTVAAGGGALETATFGLYKWDGINVR
jgi:hypothetical protein